MQPVFKDIFAQSIAKDKTSQTEAVIVMKSMALIG